MLFGNISWMVVAPWDKEGNAYKAGWYKVINFNLSSRSCPWLTAGERKHVRGNVSPVIIRQYNQSYWRLVRGHQFDIVLEIMSWADC